MVWLLLQDRAFRTEVETKKSRVSWDTQICCYLDPSGTNMWAPPQLLHIYSLWCKIIEMVFNFVLTSNYFIRLDILNWFCSRHAINWHCCVFKINLVNPKNNYPLTERGNVKMQIHKIIITAKTLKKKIDCISRLRQLITENRLWPVEILRQKPVNPKVARVNDKCMSFCYCFTIVN